MICPTCQHSVRPSFAGEVCAGCGYRFVFGKKSGDLVSDLVWSRAMTSLAGADGLRYTDGHLHGELCRRYLKSGLRRALHRLRPVSRYRFDVDLARWRAAGNATPGLLTAAPVYEPSVDVPDLDGAVFDRLVVCDTRTTADFLIANRAHMETVAPIVAVDGYPEAVFARALPAVRRSESLTVVALHDADTAGVGLPRRLLGDDAWFQREVLDGRARVVDAGLSVDVARRRGRGLLAVNEVRGAGIDWGTRRDRRWLRRNRLDLTAMPPRVTLAAVGAVFAPPPPFGSAVHDGGGDGWDMSVFAWGGDTDDG